MLFECRIHLETAMLRPSNPSLHSACMTALPLSMRSLVLFKSSPRSFMNILWTNGTSECTHRRRVCAQRVLTVPCPLQISSAFRRICDRHVRAISNQSYCVRRLQPFENETITGEMRVQITFEANKVST